MSIVTLLLLSYCAGGSNEYHLCFEQKFETYENFYLKIFIFFFVVKLSVYLNGLVFVMTWCTKFINMRTGCLLKIRASET